MVILYVVIFMFGGIQEVGRTDILDTFSSAQECMSTAAEYRDVLKNNKHFQDTLIDHNHRAVVVCESVTIS